MNIIELEKICLAICLKIINDKKVYPTEENDMKFMNIYPTDVYYLTNIRVKK